LALISTVGWTAGNILFQPVVLRNRLAIDHVAIPIYGSIQQSGSTSATSGQGAVTLVVAMYSRGTGTNQQRIELMWSRSANMSYTNSSNSRLGVTHPLATFSNSSAQSTSQYAQSNVSISSYWAATVGGAKMWMLPVSSTVPPGDYYVGWAMSSSTNYAGLAMSHWPLFQSAQSLQFSAGGLAHWGQQTSASGAGHNWPEGIGSYTVVGTTFPTNITLSNGIRMQSNTQYVPYFEFNGYATNLAVGG
jgi:hypothetical protein